MKNKSKNAIKVNSMRKMRTSRKNLCSRGKPKPHTQNTFSRSDLDAFRVLNELHANAFNMLKYISNVLFTASGMAIITLFAKNTLQFHFPLLCFSVSILGGIFCNIVAGATLYDSTRIYVNMFVYGQSKDKFFIYKNYKTFQRLVWIGIIASYLSLVVGINDAYNSITVTGL